jgi:hypothetical protein
MKFVLLLYVDERAAPPAQPAGETLYQRMFAYREALAKAGAFVASGPFERSGRARTLVPQGDELRVHDGPYPDTREQLGGYFVIEAADLDEAEHWARQCPSARTGSIEIRPLLPGF